jgi:hypothetical protein
MDKPTIRQTYEFLHLMMKDKAMHQFGYTEDKANRIATIFAVQNTWRFHNERTTR